MQILLCRKNIQLVHIHGWRQVSILSIAIVTEAQNLSRTGSDYGLVKCASFNFAALIRCLSKVSRSICISIRLNLIKSDLHTEPANSNRMEIISICLIFLLWMIKMFSVTHTNSYISVGVGSNMTSDKFKHLGKVEVITTNNHTYSVRLVKAIRQTNAQWTTESVITC